MVGSDQVAALCTTHLAAQRRAPDPCPPPHSAHTHGRSPFCAFATQPNATPPHPTAHPPSLLAPPPAPN